MDELGRLKEVAMDEVKYWSVEEEVEVLTATSPQEAVLDWLDGTDPSDTLPKTVEVTGYVPRRLSDNEPKLNAKWIVDDLLESLDEEYGGGDPVEPTALMLSAAEVLVWAVRADYQVYQHEPAIRQTMMVADVIRDHAEAQRTDEELARLRWYLAEISKGDIHEAKIAEHMKCLADQALAGKPSLRG